MKFFLLLIVVASVANVTTTSRENYQATEDSSSSEEISSSSSLESVGCKVNYRYTLWIGDNVDEIHSIHLQSKCGTILLNAMQQASEEEKEFEFEYTTHPMYGAFVTKIDGVSNDDDAKTFWMIYDLQTHPIVDSAPGDDDLSLVGVSSLEVLDGHSYLFWYKTVNGGVTQDGEEDYSY